MIYRQMVEVLARGRIAADLGVDLDDLRGEDCASPPVGRARA
jgi:hypothetical protein